MALSIVTVVAVFVALLNNSCALVYPNRTLFNYICMLSENKNSNYPVPIHISSEHEVDVSVTAPFLSSTPADQFTLPGGTRQIIFIAPSIRMSEQSTVSPKSILIQTTKPVSVIVVNNLKTNFDAVQLMELDSLGTDYVVLSYAKNGSVSFFDVAVPFNDTTLRIKVPASVNPINVSVNGQVVSTHPELTLTLQAYDALQILSVDDLTGTVISAHKKIAVFSGNTRTKTYGICLDHMLEQMPRASNLGYEYIMFSPYTSTELDGVRFVSTENDTLVTVNGWAPIEIQKEFAFSTKLFGRRIVKHIQSTRPVLVGGITFSGVKTDASLWVVDPLPYSGYKYVFSVPNATISVALTFRLAITIERGQEQFLLLDGQPLVGLSWYVSAGVAYTAAFVTLTRDTNAHVVEHADEVGFGATIHGFSECNGYSLRLNSVSSTKYTCGFMTKFRRHLKRRLSCSDSARLQVASYDQCHEACRSVYDRNCTGFNMARTASHFGFECEICSTTIATTSNDNYDCYTLYT